MAGGGCSCALIVAACSACDCDIDTTAPVAPSWLCPCDPHPTTERAQCEGSLDQKPILKSRIVVCGPKEALLPAFLPHSPRPRPALRLGMPGAPMRRCQARQGHPAGQRQGWMMQKPWRFCLVMILSGGAPGEEGGGGAVCPGDTMGAGNCTECLHSHRSIRKVRHQSPGQFINRSALGGAHAEGCSRVCEKKKERRELGAECLQFVLRRPLCQRAQRGLEGPHGIEAGGRGKRSSCWEGLGGGLLSIYA
jgi:hypothetical protein